MKIIVIPTKLIIVNLGNDSYLFSLFDNDTLEVKNLYGNEKTIYIPKNKETNLKYHKVTTIKINGSKDIEMDGSFSINIFTLDKFDQNEIVILHKGVNNNDISLYEYAIVEIKLSENKIKEMIQQLKKDKAISEAILNNIINRLR